MTAAPHPDLDARFRAEVRTSTRATGIVAGAVGVVALPAWMGFDYIVEPDHASTFALLRLIALGPMLVCLGALFTGFGRRRPELLVLAILAAVEIAIAFMIPRVETQHAAYALRMSIGIYATAFLLVWPPRYTAAAIGITWTALAAALLTAPAPLDSAGITTVAFYLATASVIAYFGQAHRERVARRELEARAALEHEQTRSIELLEELDRQSREDPLTSLANRRAWDETLARECARAARGQGPLAIHAGATSSWLGPRCPWEWPTGTAPGTHPTASCSGPTSGCTGRRPVAMSSASRIRPTHRRLRAGCSRACAWAPARALSRASAAPG